MIPTSLPKTNIGKKEISSWLKKKKLPSSKINISKATNALKAEKQKDSLPVGRDVSGTSSNDPRQIIYGKCKVGGTISYMGIRGSNQYFDIVVTIAGHEIESVEEVYLDDYRVDFLSGNDGWSKDFIKIDSSEAISATNKFYMKIMHGTDSQLALSTLVSNAPTKWTSAHRQRGCAYAYLIFKWDAAIFGDSLPEISFLVKGKKCYDPRDGVTRWTDNAALITADVLTDMRYGVRVPRTSLNLDESKAGNLITAADICDELVTLSGGGTEKRYTINGYHDCSSTSGSVLTEFVAAMGGSITMPNGKFCFWPAAWRAPVLDITEDDLRSGVKIQTLTARTDIFNVVRGTYVSAINDYAETDYPPVKNSLYQMQDADEIPENIDYKYVVSGATCQRLSKIELERIRQGIQVEVTVSLKAFFALAYENITLTLPRYGWDEKPFEIVDTNLSLSDGLELAVDLVLRETAEGVFNWANGEETTSDIAPNSDLPDPYSVAPITGLTIASGTSELYVRGDGTISPRMKVMWDSIADFFVTSGGTIEVEFKLSDSLVWTRCPETPGNSDFMYISDILDMGDDRRASYDVRARLTNAFNISSEWTSVVGYYVTGKTAPPSDVAALAVGANDIGILLVWNEIQDVDRDIYEVREGASWDVGIPIYRGKGDRLQLNGRAPGTLTFHVKAIDTSWNYSVNAATQSIVIVGPSVIGLTGQLVGDSIIIRWDYIIGSWKIDYYEISGPNGLSITTKSNYYQLKASGSGDLSFTVTAYDAYGNVGAANTVVVTITAPSVPTSIRAEVVDNNVLLRWDPPEFNSLAITGYEVRRGSTYVAGEVVGSSSSTFTVIFEMRSGAFTYWITAIDSAGNYGTPGSVVAVVSQPPDYELQDQQVLTGGTCTNCIETLDGLLAPVNITETFAEHFTTNGWTTFQDAIDDSKSIFVEPEMAYGRWVKTVDLGVILDSVLVHLGIDKEDILGVQDITPKIAYSVDGSAWTEEVDTTSVLATSLRYYRITLDFGVVP